LEICGHRFKGLTYCFTGAILCSSVCGVAGENELYIAGGDHFGASVCSMFKWSPEDNHFEDMAVMQIARKQ